MRSNLNNVLAQQARERSLFQGEDAMQFNQLLTLPEDQVTEAAVHSALRFHLFPMLDARWRGLPLNLTARFSAYPKTVFKSQDAVTEQGSGEYRDIHMSMPLVPQGQDLVAHAVVGDMLRATAEFFDRVERDLSDQFAVKEPVTKPWELSNLRPIVLSNDAPDAPLHPGCPGWSVSSNFLGLEQYTPNVGHGSLDDRDLYVVPLSVVTSPLSYTLVSWDVHMRVLRLQIRLHWNRVFNPNLVFRAERKRNARD